MRMAFTKAYPVPDVRRSGYMWKVTWADAMTNEVYYRHFATWRQAIRYATGQNPFE